MKKSLVLGLFMVLLIPFTSHAALDANLKYGMKGDAVTELQEFLTDQGVYSGPITGNFYSLTLAAVKAFQAKQSVAPVSGYWGPISRAKAQTLLDLSVSDTEEQTETGTVTPVVVTPTPAPVVTPAPVITPTPVPTAQPQDELSQLTASIQANPTDTTLSCQAQMDDLRQKINLLRATATRLESGYLTGSTAGRGQAMAEKIALQEEQDEAPLTAQLLSLQATCK